MLAIIQEIASKSYTFREVAAYVTIAVCMSFAVGFLIAAFTRIFKELNPSLQEWQRLALRGEDYYIPAIKECRLCTGLPLKDSRKKVDDWLAEARNA